MPPDPSHHGHIASLKEVAHDKPRSLLERNRAFATTGAHTGLSMMPNQPIFVVTCLGLGLGDAPVVRNAGGRMTDAVIDDIAFISYLAGTILGDGPLFEVAVIHDTNCGTGFLANPTFRTAFAARTGFEAPRVLCSAGYWVLVPLDSQASPSMMVPSREGSDGSPSPAHQ